MDGLISLFMFFFIAVPLMLINFTAYRKERISADEELRVLLKENNEFLKELIDAIKAH